MLSLPLAKYAKVAEGFHKLGVHPRQLAEQLSHSHSHIILNGTKIRVSSARLVTMLGELEANSVLARIRAEVKTGRIKATTLNNEYAKLQQEEYL